MPSFDGTSKPPLKWRRVLLKDLKVSGAAQYRSKGFIFSVFCFLLHMHYVDCKRGFSSESAWHQGCDCCWRRKYLSWIHQVWVQWL
ncbi:unnamed protein product [Brassica oleracea]